MPSNSHALKAAGGDRWQYLTVICFQVSTLALSRLLYRVLYRCCLDAAAHGPSHSSRNVKMPIGPWRRHLSRSNFTPLRPYAPRNSRCLPRFPLRLHVHNPNTLSMHPHLHTEEVQKSKSPPPSLVHRLARTPRPQPLSVFPPSLAYLTKPHRLRRSRRRARRMPRPRLPLESNGELHRRQVPGEHVPARAAAGAHTAEPRAGAGEETAHQESLGRAGCGQVHGGGAGGADWGLAGEG